jgi:hypothetical protein
MSIVAIIISVIVFLLVLVTALFATARPGHEDEDGFHFDDDCD